MSFGTSDSFSVEFLQKAHCWFCRYLRLSMWVVACSSRIYSRWSCERLRSSNEKRLSQSANLPLVFSAWSLQSVFMSPVPRIYSIEGITSHMPAENKSLEHCRASQSEYFFHLASMSYQLSAFVRDFACALQVFRNRFYYS